VNLLKTHPQRALLVLAAAWYAAVFSLFRVFEEPGLGIGHGYYVSILLVARATGPLGGAGAGLLAAVLYAAGIWWNPATPSSEVATAATLIRLFAYILVGVLAGYYAQRSRRLIEQAHDLAAELRLLARRDFLTGLPNQRALEIALNRRLDENRPFSLILCEIHARDDRPLPTERVLDFSDRLTRAVDPSADVARISQDQFAVLVELDSGSTRDTVRQIHDAFSGESRISTGWATFPDDARDGLSLYGAASDRLYARKIVYGEIADLPAARAR
jgi:GGDEF domain-containing protein